MRMLLTSWIAGSCLTLFSCSGTVHAGVLMDALINNRRPSYPIGTYQAGVPAPYAPMAQAGAPVTTGYPPVANYANVVSNYGTYTSNYAPAATPANSGYGPIPVGVPQTVPSYLPTAQYDTIWNRTPVTYYRPVTSFDPRMGTTVTSLQPCTSYQYQASRVPMIAPRALLGEYGMQSSQWPSITGPGYNPAGLGVSANYPGYQTLPNSGTFAPYGNSGNSMGMPASSLPVTTMPTQGAIPINPLPAGYNVTSGYPTNVSPVTSYPAYSTPSTYRPQGSSFTQPDGSVWTPLPSGQVNSPVNAILPATSYSAPNVTGSTGNCPNGTCPLPGATSPYPAASSSTGSTFVPAGSPYIPGASSVQPIGQPTYSSVPSNSYAPATPGAVNNSILPDGGIYPPAYSPTAQPGSRGIADPESTQQPRFNGSTSVQKATTDHLVNSNEQSNRSNRPSLEEQPLHGGMLPWNRDNRDGSLDPKPAPVDRSGKLDIPSTLPTTDSNRNSLRPNPLRAPEGMDTKALWNPDYVSPNDLEARSDASTNDKNIKSATKQSDAPIRFISGESNYPSTNSNANPGIYFRAIAPSKK